MNDDGLTHDCDQEHVCLRDGVSDRSKPGRRPAPAHWGEAISRVGLLDHRWWAISGHDAPEYATQIRYCPWCGVDLVAQMIAESDEPLRVDLSPDHRARRLIDQATRVFGRRELAIDWLHQRNVKLGCESPLDLLRKDETGAQAVEAELEHLHQARDT